MRDVAFDELLAERIRGILETEDGVTEMKAFGGLAFLVEGKMAVSAAGRGGLMVRVAPDETEDLLAEPYARPFEMRGRPLKGWLRVDAERLQTEARLKCWVTRGISYARTLTAEE
jgi:hypothetical protein